MSDLYLQFLVGKPEVKIVGPLIGRTLPPLPDGVTYDETTAELIYDGGFTPWFSWKDKPVRKGWYELRGWLIDEGVRLYWNGNQWGSWLGPVDTNWVHWALDERDEWRGLRGDATWIDPK